MVEKNLLVWKLADRYLSAGLMVGRMSNWRLVQAWNLLERTLVGTNPLVWKSECSCLLVLDKLLDKKLGRRNLVNMRVRC